MSVYDVAKIKSLIYDNGGYYNNIKKPKYNYVINNMSINSENNSYLTNYIQN